MINSPNNPTGKVFTRDELSADRRALRQRHDAIALTDEIYEHILYDGAHAHPHRHAPGHGRAHGHDQRVVEDVRRHRVARGVGDRAAPLMARIRPVHDFLTVAAAAPLQIAGDHRARAAAPRTTTRWPREYAARRDTMMAILDETGFEAAAPAGRLLRDGRLRAPGLGDDVETARRLVEEVGRRHGARLLVLLARRRTVAHLVRFAFCKKLETLEAAGERLRAL